MQNESTIEVNEQLGSYFDCLRTADRRRWLAEEVNNVSKLGLQTIGSWTLERLRTAFGGNKMIKNAPNYEILANPNY